MIIATKTDGIGIFVLLTMVHRTAWNKIRTSVCTNMMRLSRWAYSQRGNHFFTISKRVLLTL